LIISAYYRCVPHAGHRGFVSCTADKSAFWGDKKINVNTKYNVDDESMLQTFSRFHQHYAYKFPGEIRDLGCTAAHMCYVAKGRVDAVVFVNES
jgi:myo-inositol-1(or 4)-monophosphatase